MSGRAVIHQKKGGDPIICSIEPTLFLLCLPLFAQNPCAGSVLTCLYIPFTQQFTEGLLASIPRDDRDKNNDSLIRLDNTRWGSARSLVEYCTIVSLRRRLIGSPYFPRQAGRRLVLDLDP